MNLQELIERVDDKTRHQPKIPAHRGTLARDLSEANRQLITERDWPFMRRTAPFWQLPDGVFTATIGTQPSTAITFGTTSTSTPEWERFNSTALDDDLDNLIGPMLDGEVELYNRGTATFTGVQNWEDGPFALESLEAVLGAGSASYVGFLEPRFVPDGTADGTTVDVKMAWRRRQVPVDCMWPRWVNGPDGRRIPIVTSVQARDFYTTGGQVAGLDIHERIASDIQCFIIDDGAQRRWEMPGRRPQAGSTGDEENYVTVARRDYDRSHPPPIHNTLTLASNNSGASGTLVPGTTYRVFASWYVSGRYGPRSPIGEVTISAGHDSIAVSKIPAWPSGAHGNGRKVALFLSDGLTERAFYLVGLVIDPTDPDVEIRHDPRQLDTSGRPATATGLVYADFLERWDDVYASKYLHLRPWPRPTTFQRHDLTYIARPRQLLEPQDEPDPAWAAYHDVLVYKVLVDLATSFGARTAARSWQAMYEKRLRLMKQRFRPKELSRSLGISEARGRNPWPSSGVDWQG